MMISTDNEKALDAFLFKKTKQGLPWWRSG